ncbi:hypothetical protein ACRAKI_05730 [Saccharothrix isguenensis]
MVLGNLPAVAPLCAAPQPASEPSTTSDAIRTATGATAGGIVLTHAGYETTVNAVSQIVRGLRAKGLRPGRIDNTGRVVAP